MDQTLLDEIRKRVNDLFNQPNVDELRIFENQLNQLISEAKEQPELRAELSEIKIQIYRKRRELEQSSSPEKNQSPAHEPVPQAVANVSKVNPNKSAEVDGLSESQLQFQDNSTKVSNAADAMAKGDGAFYSGKIDEAAMWYERALDIDPSRERAHQRLRDIRVGNIPIRAVPPEAGMAYGRALSMYHRRNYMEAAAEIQNAIDLMGGILWRDAQELLNDCYNGQQAEEAYNDGLKYEKEGQWLAALRDYDAARIIFPDNLIYTEARDRLNELINRANLIRAELKPAYSIKELTRLQNAQESIKSLEQETSSRQVEELQTAFDVVITESATFIYETIEKPAHNVIEAKKLLDARNMIANLLELSPRNYVSRDLLQKLTTLLPESAILIAMDLANQGETKDAKELLRPFTNSPEAKKALKEITRRYREELKIGVELRRKELEDLRKQRALWFNLSAIFSALAGVILLLGSIAALLGNLTAGLISAVGSLLPGAFVRLFTNQYRELNTQLSSLLKKTPEVEKLEQLAVLSEAGLEDA